MSLATRWPAADRSSPSIWSSRRGGETRPRGSYHRQVDDLRRSWWPARWCDCASNFSEAARRLGVSRQTLSYLIRQLGIDGNAASGTVEGRGVAAQAGAQPFGDALEPFAIDLVEGGGLVGIHVEHGDQLAARS